MEVGESLEHAPSRILFIAAAALGVIGCSSDRAGAGGAGGDEQAAQATISVTLDAASSVGPAATAATGGIPECRDEGWTPTNEEGVALDGSTFFYSAVARGEDSYDALDVQFFDDRLAVGSFPIATSDYYSCTLCVHIVVGCDPDSDPLRCRTDYLANAGTIEVESVTDRFVGRLRDVEMVEVSLQDNIYSKPVPRGLTWCLDDYEFDVPIEQVE